MTGVLPPSRQPDLETLWSARACAEGNKLCQTLDTTDADVGLLLEHIESCEVCTQAITDALNEFLR